MLWVVGLFVVGALWRISSRLGDIWWELLLIREELEEQSHLTRNLIEEDGNQEFGPENVKYDEYGNLRVVDHEEDFDV